MNTIAALDVAGAICLLCGLTLGAVIVIELAWVAPQSLARVMLVCRIQRARGDT